MKVFTEKQRFNQWWLIAIEVIAFGVVLGGVITDYNQIVNQGGVDSLFMVFLSLGLFLLAIVFIHSIKLFTRIDESGIHFQFFPLHVKERNIAWAEVSSCEVRKYNPILEYGGWGIRGFSKEILFGIGKNGRAYNTKGTMGIQLELKDGRKILIGTQKSEQAQKTIVTYRSKYGIG